MSLVHTMQSRTDLTLPQTHRNSFFNFSKIRDLLVGCVLVFAYFFVPRWVGDLRLYSYNWELFYAFNVLINLICAWYVVGRLSLKYVKHHRLLAGVGFVVAIVIVVVLPMGVYRDLAMQLQQYSGKMRLVQSDKMRLGLVDKKGSDNQLIVSDTDFKRFTQAMCRCGDGSSVKIDFLPHTARIVNFECREFGSQRMPEPWQSQCR